MLFRKFTFKHAYMAISKRVRPIYDETPKTGFLVTSTLKEIFSKTIKAAHKMFDYHMSLVMRKPGFAYAKTKTQISYAVTAQLISAFVFATQIAQSLFFLNPKFQASSHFLWLYSPVCVGPGRKSRRPVFSQRGSHLLRIQLSITSHKRH